MTLSPKGQGGGFATCSRRWSSGMWMAGRRPPAHTKYCSRGARQAVSGMSCILCERDTATGHHCCQSARWTFASCPQLAVLLDTSYQPTTPPPATHPLSLGGPWCLLYSTAVDFAATMIANLAP
jgi:hypothetical protein